MFYLEFWQGGVAGKGTLGRTCNASCFRVFLTFCRLTPRNTEAWQIAIKLMPSVPSISIFSRMASLPVFVLTESALSASTAAVLGQPRRQCVRPDLGGRRKVRRSYRKDRVAVFQPPGLLSDSRGVLGARPLAICTDSLSSVSLWSWR